jgi:hypothetical protein
MMALTLFFTYTVTMMLSYLLRAGLQIRIQLILGSRIRIRIRVKSWIRNPNLGAVEAPNGAMEGRGRSQLRHGGSNGAVEGLYSVYQCS